MSEQPTATASRAAPKGAAGKKYAGLTRNQWFIVGGVFVAALGYILWKRHQASTAAAAGSTGATNAGSNECTDANGNPVDCNAQFAQELADMANALDQLQAQQGGSGAGGSGVTGTVGTQPPDTVSGAPATTQPSGTPTTSTGGTTTKTAPKTAGAITGLKSSNVTKTSFTASWNAAANATGGYQYIVRDLASHTQVGQPGNTKSTSVTVSGLKSGTDYNFGIQALPGGVGDNMHVKTK